MTRTARPAARDDLGHGGAEVLAVGWRQRRDETAELRAEFGVEGGRRPLPGVGQRHLQRAPVPWHGSPPGQPALLGPVHEPGERGLLHAEAVGQLGHAPGPVKHHAP